MKRLITCSAILLFTVSCDFDPTFEYRIDSRLQPYVDKFYYEASVHGVSLRNEMLTVSVGVIDEHGQTYDDRDVVINETFLSSYPDYSEEVEVIVFHELGHALLHRGHTNSKSIMLKSPCINCYKNNPEKRAEYINELFTPHK